MHTKKKNHEQDSTSAFSWFDLAAADQLEGSGGEGSSVAAVTGQEVRERQERSKKHIHIQNLETEEEV